MSSLRPPGPSEIVELKEFDHLGNSVSVWQPSFVEDRGHRPWACYSASDKKTSLIAPLQFLIDGGRLVIQGEAADALTVSQRINWIIHGTNLSYQKKWDLKYRCMVGMSKQKILLEKHQTPSCEYWPGVLGKMAEASRRDLTYVPTDLLLWLLYRLTEQSFSVRRPTFVDETTNIWDDLLGCHMKIRPEVLVPDARVMDLLVAAWLDETSSLKEHIQGQRVIEPCTGSGVLAIVLAQLGAASVLSSDIHQKSVACASENVSLLGLSDTIEVMEHYGFPTNAEGKTMVVNPPWYSFIGGDDGRYRRCLEDRGHEFLMGLLTETAKRSEVDYFYLFLGLKPFMASPLKGDDSIRRGWQVADHWSFGSLGDFDTSIVLYLLRRIGSRHQTEATAPRRAAHLTAP